MKNSAYRPSGPGGYMGSHREQGWSNSSFVGNVVRTSLSSKSLGNWEWVDEKRVLKNLWDSYHPISVQIKWTYHTISLWHFVRALSSTDAEKIILIMIIILPHQKVTLSILHNCFYNKSYVTSLFYNFHLKIIFTLLWK